MTDQINQIKPIIELALQEDIGKGDITTRLTVPESIRLSGRFIAKESGVVAGLEVAGLTFSLIDRGVEFTPSVVEGSPMNAGTVIATVAGPGHALLTGERVALNFLGRMSGIATLTRRFVEAVEGTSTVILDTRKTAPGLRPLDRWAVRLGGGQNHRFGLFDFVIIKDNHIAAVGSISEAVARVRAMDKNERSIEVEAKTLADVGEAVELNIDRIMLDNMSLDEIEKAVRLVNHRVPLEVSGNVTLENVTHIAATGVDYVSVGMLTHSSSALDISLELS